MRGVLAAAIPFPTDEQMWKSVRAPYMAGGLRLNANGTITTPEGHTCPWTDEFVGPVGDDLLSKTRGPRGHLQHADRRVTLIRWHNGGWQVIRCEPSPVPAIAKKLEPEAPVVPANLTLVYRYIEAEVLDGDFQGRPGGYFTLNGREHSRDQELDYDCPVSGNHVKQRAGTGVVCIRSGGLQRVFKHSRPNLLQRILAHPTGWYTVTAFEGRRRNFNTFFVWLSWSPLPTIAIVALGIYLAFAYAVLLLPWAIFLLPLLWLLTYCPSRRNLPPAFFDDGAEAYFKAERIHKAVHAEEFTVFHYFGALFQQR